MRKLALIFMVISFFIISCGGEKMAKKEEGMKATPAASGDAAKELIGNWEGTDVGELLPNYGITLPTKLVFNADGSYEMLLTLSGTPAPSKGTYKIDASKKPYTIEITDSKGNKGAGVWDIVTEDGVKKLLFHTLNTAKFPTPTELEEGVYQTYKKK